MHFTIFFWNASILKPLFTITENLHYVKEKKIFKKGKKSNNLIPLAAV